jgi:hypothetical protein
MTQEQFEVTVVRLDSKMDRMADSVETIKNTQVEMNEKLTNLGKAIYNPDEGLYARIKNQEAEIEDLKVFQSNITKFLWLVTSAITGILIKFGFDLAN